MDKLTLALELETFSPGDVLVREKEPMDKCYFILHGDVSEVKSTGEFKQVRHTERKMHKDTSTLNDTLTQIHTH